MGILSLLCLMCGPIPWLMIALADTAEMPFSQRQHTNTPEMAVGLMTSWPYWVTPLASLASDSSWFPESNYNSGDYGLSLPYPDTNIWLRQETFLPNWVGRMAHQPER